MLDSIREYILTLVGAALLCGAVKALTPPGVGKRAMGVVCGFTVAAAALAFTGKMGADVGMYVDRYRSEAAQIAGDAKSEAEIRTRFIIEERCEAYISDKAALLGVELRAVSVTALWSGEGFWYPAGCRLRGDESVELTRAIEADLGIARDRIEWCTDDGR